ncbi:MAG: FCD domain-containing protein [Streptosporangiales bacterium]|nr:FCD domain-containing protein [Streptosporangiales bacterium]
MRSDGGELTRVTARPEDRLGDTVYERLRDEILSGELPAGTRLSVPAIAERLAVSRSPVRDAVLRLTQHRLAHEVPRRGAVVARITAADLVAIYEVREVMEGLAARLAVENAGRRLVDRLADVLAGHERVVAASDVSGHMDADMRFHELIRRECGNDEVTRVLDEIQGKVRLAMRTTTVTAGPRQAVRDHRAILAAIRKGDPAAAENAARAHVARLRRALLDELAGA